MGDELRIKQILLNLPNHAVKFTEQGRVYFAVHALESDQFQFEITDTGIGMTPAELETIFKPFVQVDNSVARGFGGTSLGLTIVKLLVEQMNGKLHLASQPNKGSTVLVTLPLTVVSDSLLSNRPADGPQTAQSRLVPEGAPPSDVAEKPLQGLHILVAEDNDMNQLIVESSLREYGADISLACNGKEAIESVTRREKPIDLILMDIQMPIMDGVEATRHIKTLDGAQDLPIVALSANAIKSEIETCLNAGMQEYLTKPLNTDLLVNTIKKLTSIKR